MTVFAPFWRVSVILSSTYTIPIAVVLKFSFTSAHLIFTLLLAQGKDAQAKAVRFVALLKSINIISQTKPQILQSSGGAAGGGTWLHTTPEQDQERSKKCVQEIKGLFPNHESVS